MLKKEVSAVAGYVAECYENAFFSKHSEISNAYYNAKMRAIRSTAMTYFNFDLLSDLETSFYHEPPGNVSEWVLNNRLVTLKFIVLK